MAPDVLKDVGQTQKLRSATAFQPRLPVPALLRQGRDRVAEWKL